MHTFFVTRLSPLLLLICLAAPLAMADSSIDLDDVWARATAPGSPNGAGYLVITNHSEQTQALTGASFEGAERVEIHRSSEQDGMARMERVRDGISIAPHESFTLAPKGYHLMLINLDQPLVAGDQHRLTLTLEPAGEVTTTLQVRPHDSDAGGASHDHHHHH